MTARLRRYLCVGLLACSSVLAWPLEITEGRMRLTLHEGIGRFSLSSLSNLKSSAYVPLIVAQDPRTTVLGVVVGNKVYRMGETADFSETVEKTAGGARFTWRSSLVVVTESFTFISSPGSPIADGVRVDITVRNVSEQELSVGLRYLYDTYLGEASFVHFRTDTLAEVARELTVSGDTMPKYWVSPLSGDLDEFGLQCMTSGAGVTVPDRVEFANWKRLNDASWSYETSPSRNFNLLPYSVNDSAVCHYYDPRPVARGTETSVVILMGKHNAAGFAIAAVATGAGFDASMKQALAITKDIDDMALGVRADISTVNKLIAEIDRKIQSGEVASKEDITLMRTVVADLEARAARYSTDSGE